MKKKEVPIERVGSPLMEKIIQNAIIKKKGIEILLPQNLPDDVFDELAAFSCKFLEGENDGDELCYETIYYCVTQIFDHQQNSYKHSKVEVSEDSLLEAICTYCMALQLELITRTKSLGIIISRPTLHDIFDEEREVKVKSSLPSSSPKEVKNLSLNVLTSIKDQAALNDIKEDATLH